MTQNQEKQEKWKTPHQKDGWKKHIFMIHDTFMLRIGFMHTGDTNTWASISCSSASIGGCSSHRSITKRAKSVDSASLLRPHKAILPAKALQANLISNFCTMISFAWLPHCRSWQNTRCHQGSSRRMPVVIPVRHIKAKKQIRQHIDMSVGSLIEWFRHHVTFICRKWRLAPETPGKEFASPTWPSPDASRAISYSSHHVKPSRRDKLSQSIIIGQ